MQGIRTETSRKMRWAWGLSVATLAFPCLWACTVSPSANSVPIAVLVLAPMVFACFPLIGELNDRMVLRRVEEQGRRRREYGISPGSRLLRLDDAD